MDAGEQTYEAAGVSIAKADAVVERLRAAVESTGATGFGAFAGLHPLDGDRFLAASTDSVGTKLILARERGALRACGADLAAHCINDVSTCGADPLFFLDYVAANRIELETVAELVEGAAEVCRAAGCALIGGETAELPGIYREDELDFAGTCVGLVERGALIDGSRIEAGDAVVGLPSAGVHANGFTLVRRVLEVEDYTGDDLLAPTRLYLDEVRRLRGTCFGIRARDGRRNRREPRARAACGTPGRDRLGCVGATAGVRLARAPRIRGGAAARLQPRYWISGRRARSRRRARDRKGRAGVIGVLVSGEGTNLQALLDADLPVVAVASNVRGARALARAEAAGAATATFALDDYSDRDARDLAMAEWLEGRGVELVVCAGYMHLLRPSFLERFPQRVVNVHPAPLPEFPGAHPLDDVLAAGAPAAAATVHYVDGGVDTGEVIASERVPVLAGDTVETLRERVHAAEHRLLPKVVRELCAR